MNHLLKLLFAIILVIGCSSEPCSRDAWIGTYSKISEDCDNVGAPFFEQTRTLEAGVCPSCLDNGSSIDLLVTEDCTAVMQSQFGDITMTLDGDMMTVAAPSVNCFATYEKQ